MEEKLIQPEETHASIIKSQDLAYCNVLFTDLITKNKELAKLSDHLEKAKTNLKLTKERLELFPENENIKTLFDKELEIFNKAKHSYSELYDTLIMKFKQNCDKAGVAYLCAQFTGEDIIPKEEMSTLSLVSNELNISIISPNGICLEEIITCYGTEIIEHGIAPYFDLKTFSRLRQVSKVCNSLLGNIGIHYLDLAEVPVNITDENFAQCFTLYPMIKRLSVPSTFTLLGREIVVGSGNKPTAFELAFRELKKLEILEFNGQIKWFGEDTFGDTFQNFFVSFPNLASIKEFYHHNADGGKTYRFPDKMGDNIANVLSIIGMLDPNRLPGNLTTLSLPHCGLANFGFNKVVNLKTLTHLNLSGNEIDDRSATWLVGVWEHFLDTYGHILEWKVLDLSDHKNISDENKQKVKEKFGDVVKF